MQSSAIRISVLGFIASCCFSYFILPILVESQNINTDPDRFGQLAASIAQGNGFVYEKGGPPVLERTPLYAFIVAGLFKVVGGFSLSAVQLLQALFHAASAFIIYLIGARLYSKRTGVVAQFLFALNPIVIWYTARIWLETTEVLVLLLIAFMMIQLLEVPSMKGAFAVGLLIGIGCLTKSTLLLFPFVVLGLLLYRFKSIAIKQGVVVIAATFILIVPWTWRNYQVTSSFLPVNTSLGFNLIQGDVIGEHWPSSDMTTIDSWIEGKGRVDSVLSSSGVAWESIEGDRTLTTFAVGNYLRHPLHMVHRVIVNLTTFWYLSESPAKSLLFGLLQVSLLVLSILSYFKMSVPARKSTMPLIIICVYLFFVSGLVVGWGRYSMPLIPFLLLIASPLLHTILFRRHETKS
ncbi:MAG: glycosyltransferase family 39 protein [bacterium]